MANRREWLVNMGRKISELREECFSRGIELPEGKISSKVMIKLLAEYSIEQRGGWGKLSWGLQQRLKLDDLMLCYSYKHLKLEEQQECMESDNWIAERKLNGCRMLITYHPDEGFGFFSRNISVTDFLPIDYTNKILIKLKRLQPDWCNLEGEGLVNAKSLKGVFPYSFVLDAEALCDKVDINTTLYRGKQGTVTGSKLNAVITILAIETDISHRIQREQAPLRLVVFDVLQSGVKMSWKEDLWHRLNTREYLVDQLKHRVGIEISEVDSNCDSKQEFYEKMLAEGDEGIVLKNMHSPYIRTSSRSKRGFVKRKRSMEEAGGVDIDAYITGFVPSNSKNAWAHLIGGLEMSTALVDENGNERETVIAVVSAMTMVLREAMTIYDGEGKPVLNPRFLRKVLVINGQDVSPKSKRFMHAVCDWDRGFREDKSWTECRMEEKFLDSQVL